MFYIVIIINTIFLLSLSSYVYAESTPTNTFIENETNLRILHIEQYHIKRSIEKLEEEQNQLKAHLISLEEEQAENMNDYEKIFDEIDRYQFEYQKTWKKTLPVFSGSEFFQKDNSFKELSFFQRFSARNSLKNLKEIEKWLKFFDQKKETLIQDMSEKNEYISFINKKLLDIDSQKVTLRSRLFQLIQEIQKKALVHQALVFKDSSDSALLSQKSFSKRKGNLTWPLMNPSHPSEMLQSIETSFSQDGIIITHNKNAQVIAIAEGDVVFSDNLSGYENLIIIDHGDGFHTLYGGLSETMVMLGNHLVLGQLIGYLSANTELYFGIRSNGKPLDPLSWLTPNESE